MNARILLLLLLATLCNAQQWRPLGPDGGDVRSFAYDPKNPDRMFLGTSAGQLYLSTDHGKTWFRFAHLGDSTDMVLDNIVIDFEDSNIMYVAGWSVDSISGDVFRSRNGGKTWETAPDMHGKSIRALAMAPSDHLTLVAGALDGVYRSRDSGDSWRRISPEHHAEIKDIESVAIDPANPDIIYAGTWHLPWKTDDGGKHWHSIKKGVIEDSDVFSIIINPADPAVVYMSACSGIYKSESAGELFHKIQGIPSSARRTRMLKMEPGNPNVVYAGTTEGLWKTTDAGVTWTRMTASNVIVNGIAVDPRNTARVMLATDRSGVLASDDGSASFTASNRGFAHRQVASVLVDRIDSSMIYAGVLNDKEFGGVFVTRNGGEDWKQLSNGLNGRDVFALRQAEDGSIIAGTNRGIFQFARKTARWQPLNILEENKPAGPELREVNVKPAVGPQKADKKAVPVPKPNEITARVNALELGPEKWFAASSAGLLVSGNQGHTWKLVAGSPKDLISVSSGKNMVVTANHHAVMISMNGGDTWLPAVLSHAISIVNAITVDHYGNIWLAAPEGAFRSANEGESWSYIPSLKLSNVTAIQDDEDNHRILATGAVSTSIFESTDNGRTWRRIEAGWQLRDLQSSRDRLVAATAFDGLVIQPEPTPVEREISRNGASQ